jgi:hypothetical protein
MLLVESLYGMRVTPMLKKLGWIEVGLNIMFLIEFILRVSSCPSLWELARDIQTWLDLLALLPALLQVVRARTFHVASECVISWTHQTACTILGSSKRCPGHLRGALH